MIHAGDPCWSQPQPQDTGFIPLPSGEDGGEGYDNGVANSSRNFKPAALPLRKRNQRRRSATVECFRRCRACFTFKRWPSPVRSLRMKISHFRFAKLSHLQGYRGVGKAKMAVRLWQVFRAPQSATHFSGLYQLATTYTAKVRCRRNNQRPAGGAGGLGGNGSGGGIGRGGVGVGLGFDGGFFGIRPALVKRQHRPLFLQIN